MAVVKNIATLNEEERKKFTRVLTNYLRRKQIVSAIEPSHFAKAKQFLMAKRDALTTISDIQKGTKTGFVSYDFDFESKRDGVAMEPSGFIIGFDTGEGNNNLMHLYAVDTPQSYPRLNIIRDLFAEYVEVAKSNGSHYIQTESSISEEKLPEDLDALDFEKAGLVGREEIYNKTI